MENPIDLAKIQDQVLQLFQLVGLESLDDPGIWVWQAIGDYFPSEDASGQFWWKTTGFPFARLLFNAGYTIDAQCKHLLFYLFYVIPALGAGPEDQDKPKWNSFMTDSHTPIELSWEWGCPGDKPTIRYSIEPISFTAGTPTNPTNRDATSHLLQHFRKLYPGNDLTWFNHFSDQLLSYEEPRSAAPQPLSLDLSQFHEKEEFNTTEVSPDKDDTRGIITRLQKLSLPLVRKFSALARRNSACTFEPTISPPHGLGNTPRSYSISTSPDVLLRKPPNAPTHKSRTFLAFDLHSNSVVMKGYMMPTFLAARTSMPTLDLIKHAIAKLSLLQSVQFPAFEMLLVYLTSHPFGRSLEPEIFSVDCLPSAQNRLKMYLRSEYTSLNSIRATMTLGGVLLDGDPLFKQGLYELEKLWKLVLGKTAGLGANEELVVNDHRTAGVLYYFEMKPGQRLPTPKLYIPVRHYGESDIAVEKGLADYLQEKGQGELVARFGRVMQEMRDTSQTKRATGVQTYITCVIVKGRLKITSYLSPEVY